jgi:hypothetical protein
MMITLTAKILINCDWSGYTDMLIPMFICVRNRYCYLLTVQCTIVFHCLCCLKCLMSVYFYSTFSLTMFNIIRFYTQRQRRCTPFRKCHCDRKVAPIRTLYPLMSLVLQCGHESDFVRKLAVLTCHCVWWCGGDNTVSMWRWAWRFIYRLDMDAALFVNSLGEEDILPYGIMAVWTWHYVWCSGVDCWLWTWVVEEVQ